MEGWHKYIRSFKSGLGSRARQCSIEDNLKDVFTRILDMTHPKISKYSEDVICNECSEIGHTSRSCHYSTEDEMVSSEDEEIQQFYTE